MRGSAGMCMTALPLVSHASKMGDGTRSPILVGCGADAKASQNEAPRSMTIGNELAGRVALVTGAGRNIGRAIALTLAAAGAAVVINGRHDRRAVEAVAVEIAGMGGRALPVLADVTDEAAVKRMTAAAIEAFGQLDILINNAAVRPEKSLAQMSLTDWHGVLGVILDGAFLTVKATLAHLQASGAGAIVNIGGVSGQAGARERAHVVTAKAGLVGFTRALAHELAGDNITVNCVAPGLIDKSMLCLCGVDGYAAHTTQTKLPALNAPERMSRDPGGKI